VDSRHVIFEVHNVLENQPLSKIVISEVQITECGKAHFGN
jgi:hypothetical protein